MRLCNVGRLGVGSKTFPSMERVLAVLARGAVEEVPFS
jgi:hypothetical protein